MRCYNAGDIYANASSWAFLGGVLGSVNLQQLSDNSSSVASTYWHNEKDQEANGDNSRRQSVGRGEITDGSKGLNDFQMKQQCSYEGFDFQLHWEIESEVNQGFPTLRGLANGGEPDDPPDTPENTVCIRVR